MSLRPYLTLGRVSNLPTVWSNLLCGLILAGTSASAHSALPLFVGATLLYLGGMYMNDFCDAAWDKAHGKQRPIVIGAVSHARVRMLSALLMGGGLATLCTLGKPTSFVAILLALLICAYNLTHKRWGYAFILMAGCRASLYWLASLSVLGEIPPLLWIASLVQFLYVAGVTLLARNEESSKSFNPFGLATLGVACGTALLARSTAFTLEAAAGGILLFAWIALSLFRAQSGGQPHPAKAIGPLLAGIPLLDLVLLSAPGDLQIAQAAPFAAFFAIALLAQRFIPAS